VSHRQPVVSYTNTGTRLEIAIGEDHVARILHRAADASTEFFVDGRSVVTLPDSAGTKYVFSRVVGTAADFSFLPPATTRSLWFYPSAQATSCGNCGERQSAP
jgi:hypothetical protein